MAAARDPWELVWTADGAMYMAKQKGPGQIHWLDCHGQRPKPAESERCSLLTRVKGISVSCLVSYAKYN